MGKESATDRGTFKQVKTAVISDVHSNIEALTAVFSDFEDASIERVICLGDIVGYGADPEECLLLIKERCDEVVAGNHDYAVRDLEEYSLLNPYAAEAIDYTRSILTEEWKSYLESLPMIFKENEIVYVHSSPHKPENWSYIVSREDALYEFRYFKGSAAFIGHSHKSGIYCHDGDTFDDEVILNENKRYIINVGSVGQPRDGNSHAAYAVYDEEMKKVSINRVKYDVEAAAGKIRKAGLPDFLSSRLTAGI